VKKDTNNTFDCKEESGWMRVRRNKENKEERDSLLKSY